MIYVKEGTKERISNWKDNSIHILTDFDRTLTTGESESSWGILSKSKIVPEEYVEERQKLYQTFRPIEIDETIDYETKNKLMIQWWTKHINLLIKYQITQKQIEEAANNYSMIFRNGSKEFLESMKNRNIPVIIISAGIGNFVEAFLRKNNCYFDNIYVISNFIKYENGKASGISGNIIHSLNKNEQSLPKNINELIKDRTNIILLGDNISDIDMAKEEHKKEALKIGFLNEKIEENKKYFEKEFDVVCYDNSNFSELTSEITILK